MYGSWFPLILGYSKRTRNFAASLKNWQCPGILHDAITVGHFKSRLSLIVRVNVVLNRTVVVDSDWRFDNLCGTGSHLQSQSELYHVSWWYYTLVIDLIGQLRRDVIGHLSVKTWVSVLQSFSRSYLCLISSISRLYGAGNCWLRFSGVCSKFVNQLSKVRPW